MPAADILRPRCEQHGYLLHRSVTATMPGSDDGDDDELFTSEHSCCASLKALEKLPNIAELSVGQMRQASGCTSKTFNYGELGLNYFALSLEHTLKHSPLAEGRRGNFYDIGKAHPAQSQLTQPSDRLGVREDYDCGVLGAVLGPLHWYRASRGHAQQRSGPPRRPQGWCRGARSAAADTSRSSAVSPRRPLSV